MRLRLLLIVGALLCAAPAFAGNELAPIPAEQTGGKTSGLEMRVVHYDGSVNGELTIEVRNRTQKSAEFSARGLYFVPDGNPDRAPQRLGAVGPFQEKTANGWQRKSKLTLAPGATAQLKLDVYCIDSQRGSPSSSTEFHPAKGRVPQQIVDAIDKDATKATETLGGVSAPAAKSSVQSEVWKNRDKKWIQLDGEGKQEAAKQK
jgi:hypothetical protein